MKCPDCGFNNPEKRNFCGHCGTQIQKVCPSCNSNSPTSFRFCGDCGTQLGSPGATNDLAKIKKYIPSYLAEKIQQSEGRIEGERKEVTVVFADISGFTSLAETRDLEEVRNIVIRCHTMLGNIVNKYEGVVDKIVGDGLMAIFGAPVHEDDPERAILTAIDMQSGMDKLSKELEKDLGIPLGLSIGINTGVVIIGDISTDQLVDYTVIGDVVNTASRIQGQAKAGEILVTKETYKRTSHFFDFQVLEPVVVRGKSKPLQICKVNGRKENPLNARGIEGMRAPLIGRDREFAICREIVEQLTAGKGKGLFITGEAGLGKSRLVEELKGYAKSQDVMWLEGRCVSYSVSVNYWVFIDALKKHFGIKSEADPDSVKHTIQKSGLVNDVAESAVSTIASFLSSNHDDEGISDDLVESEKKMRIFNAVKDILAAESQIKPMILVLDDLHWADELSIELILFLLKELSQDRITFVCVHRPLTDELDPWPVKKLVEEYLRGKSEASTRYTRIMLSPLSNLDSNLLLGSLLTMEDLAPRMRNLILGKSGGNPLYLEEVIRSIIDDKAIEQRDGKWLAVKEVEEIEVPSTIQGVILARIDRLKEEPKHILQNASVIGRSFEYELLSYVVNGLDELEADEDAPELRVCDATLDEYLEQLEGMGFISREESDAKAFRFRHVLIQDVAYGTIMKRRRRQSHETVCRYIETSRRDNLDEFYEILAYHYTNSNNIESALSYLVKAGNKNRKSATGSAESALRYFHQAQEILRDSSLAHDECLLYKQGIYDGIGEVYKDLGEYEKALSSFEMLLQAAEEGEAPRMKAEALRQIANNKTQMGDWETALESYEKSLAIARNADNPTQIGLVYNDLGHGYFERGVLDEGIEYFQEALKIGIQSGDLSLIGDASGGLGTIASLRHEFDEAIRNYQISLRSYEEVGESHYVSQIYNNLGNTYFKREEPKAADEYYTESLAISEKCGYNRLRAYTYLNVAELALSQSDLNKATDFCIKAFEILRTLDDKWAVAEGHKFYGMIYKRQQDLQLAQEAFQTSLEISRECDHLPNIAEVYREMGLMYEEEGMQERALEHFEKSREAFEKLEIMEEVQQIDRYIDEAKSTYAGV